MATWQGAKSEAVEDNYAQQAVQVRFFELTIATLLLTLPAAPQLLAPDRDSAILPAMRAEMEHADLRQALTPKEKELDKKKLNAMRAYFFFFCFNVASSSSAVTRESSVAIWLACLSISILSLSIAMSFLSNSLSFAVSSLSYPTKRAQY